MMHRSVAPQLFPEKKLRSTAQLNCQNCFFLVEPELSRIEQAVGRASRRATTLKISRNILERQRGDGGEIDSQCCSENEAPMPAATAAPGP